MGEASVAAEAVAAVMHSLVEPDPAAPAGIERAAPAGIERAGHGRQGVDAGAPGQ
ncbi:hypothetical protein [Kitasatospora griseola]|uniref:hypothetical protein n=1 Tax=Kitasatospora griseola TaxID=2064 RepID=UPI0038241FD6